MFGPHFSRQRISLCVFPGSVPRWPDACTRRPSSSLSPTKVRSKEKSPWHGAGCRGTPLIIIGQGLGMELTFEMGSGLALGSVLLAAPAPPALCLPLGRLHSR